MTYFKMNDLRAVYYAGTDTSGLTHSGIAVVAQSTGNVFLAQRTLDETDPPDVQQTWEFPGGSIEDGERPWDAAIREFTEETGFGLPEGQIVNAWRSANGVYQGFVYATPEQFDISDWVPTAECQAVAWVSPEGAQQMSNLRPEMADFDWSLVRVSGNEDTMDNETPTEDATESMEEPDLSYGDIAMHTIPIHGVLAPEGVETGDGRGFNEGSMTSRPLRIPFSWQKYSEEGHNRSVVVGSVDRLMRQGGLVHWEGQLMCCSEEGDEFANLLAFMGRFGVSVDGDKGSIDGAKTSSSGVLWFDAVRAAGLTAVAIPAFPEAYVEFGPHPTMPVPASDAEKALVSSGFMAGRGVVFDRGPGWVTDPKATRRIHDYWMPGHPGGDKIAWGTPGDFARAKALIGEKIGLHSPDKVRFLNAIIAQWHHDALGYWPATHAKMDRAGTKAAGGTFTLMGPDTYGTTFKDYPAEQRKKMADEGQALPDGSFPIANEADLRNAIQSIGRAKDPAKAKAHIKKRAAALGLSDLIPEAWQSGGIFTFDITAMDPALEGEAYCIHEGCGKPGEFSVSSNDPQWDGIFCAEHAPEHEGVSLWNDYEEAVASSTDIAQTDAAGWEAVLVSSVQTTDRVRPDVNYFDRHPDTDALVIEEPDEFGFRRTYGYAGEWGVCHVGFENRCVELPDEDGDFPEFHLGRTLTSDGYVNTGLITYKVDHRGSQRILTETATQQHYDNVANAWAAVRLGQDDRGIWFSGVVLPTVPEDDLVLIEAAGQVSGEWKYGNLRALQAVNVPGFPVLRSSARYDENGEIEILVASGRGGSCEPTPAERMEALKYVDAETRFARLRELWEN